MSSSSSSGAAAGYEVLGEIGRGTFGKVSRVRRLRDGAELVWKELHYGNMGEREKRQLVSEVNILREFTHPHIVRYYDRLIDRENKKIFIVMEFCRGGDLASLIKKSRVRGKLIDEGFIWRVLAQVASALETCHSKDDRRIMHRDIKPGNVFLDADGNTKLGDFGLARILENSADMANTHVGTPYYMSPEQVTERRYDERSDMWSLGCLIYQLATLKPPFRARNQLSLALKIQRGVFEPLSSRYSQELHAIVAELLRIDPARRPTAEKVVRAASEAAAAAVKKRSKRVLATKSVTEVHDATLRERVGALEKRERAVKAAEARLRAWEADLKRREKLLVAAGSTRRQEFETPPTAVAAAPQARKLWSDDEM